MRTELSYSYGLFDVVIEQTDQTGLFWFGALFISQRPFYTGQQDMVVQKSGWQLLETLLSM